MNWKDFKKKIGKIKFKSNKEWEIFLPYDTPVETLQDIIDKGKEEMELAWHRIHTLPTEKKPEPDIRMYWEHNEIDQEV